jgi:hypothetical protein
VHQLHQVDQTSVNHVGIRNLHRSLLLFCDWVLLGLESDGELPISQEGNPLELLEITA